MTGMSRLLFATLLAATGCVAARTAYKGDSIRGTASEIPPGVIALIAREPAEYYVKLHTPAFPAARSAASSAPVPPTPAWSETGGLRFPQPHGPPQTSGVGKRPNPTA
jgi:hypothetical protein